MKNLMILESIIIGFFVGIAASTYMIFMQTMEKGVGNILDTISLTFVLNSTQYEKSILLSFLFYIIVYLVYVFFINLIIKINKKVKFITILIIVLLLVGVIFQQNKSFKFSAQSNSVNESIIIPLEKVQEIKKYFGEKEFFGDLNGDNKNDVAYVIKIDDIENENTSFYISASLKESDGYIAKNILFVGTDLNIDSINIENNKIYLKYSKDDEVETFVAEIVNDELQEYFEEEVSEEESVSVLEN